MAPFGTFFRKLADAFRELAAPAAALGPPREFEGHSAPDWVLEWNGFILPHGGRFRGRLALRETAVSAVGQAEYVRGRVADKPPRSLLLDTAAVVGLLDVLRQSFDTLASVSSRVIDGCPFELVAYRRQPYRCVRVRCNLSEGWGDAPRTGGPLAPIFLLGKVLLAKSLATGDETA